MSPQGMMIERILSHLPKRFLTISLLEFIMGRWGVFYKEKLWKVYCILWWFGKRWWVAPSSGRGGGFYKVKANLICWQVLYGAYKKRGRRGNWTLCGLPGSNKRECWPKEGGGKPIPSNNIVDTLQNSSFSYFLWYLFPWSKKVYFFFFYERKSLYWIPKKVYGESSWQVSLRDLCAHLIN